MSNGWETPGAAEKYMKIIDVVAPGRKEILNIISSLATQLPPEQLKIMDLGCGWGQVTEEILKYAPGCSVVMLDYSEEMVVISKQRFKENPNVQVLQHDLNQGLIDKKQEYDAVVSCFALHHVEYEKRLGLYSDIRKILKPDGIFINGDLFKCESPSINNWEFGNYIWWMLERVKVELGDEYTFSELKQRQLDNYQAMGDKPGTIWDMYNELRMAGFKYVDCLYKNQNLAVLAASNI
ncbi:methyltransferase type 12 [hydrocarbon metagenome]|uniref:Methyltransferase type 12 n=1 Tax=hydrocarbon metagenome TaxID=938273 RepID=A0A0W8E5T8_9ZZZZ